MEGSGGYDVEFVEELAEYLTCVVCHLAFRKPVLLIDCGHRLCHSCFEDMKDHAQRSNTEVLCPHDRMKVDASKVCEDKGISRVILDLKVKCQKHTDGCLWTGELRDFEVHITEKCTFHGKEEQVIIIVNRLEKRIINCERNLLAKEEELRNFKLKLSQKDEEIILLKKKVDTSDRRISSLENTMKQLKCSAMPSTLNTERNKQSCGASNLPSHSKVIPEIQVNKKQFDMVSKKVNQLEKQVKVVEQVISNKKVVYVWNIKDYHYERGVTDVGGELCSPKFYSSVLNGHCCQLFVRWFGNKKGRLGVYFRTCRDDNGIIDMSLQQPFDMQIELAAVSEDGEEETDTTNTSDIEDELDIDYHSGESEGIGNDHFLNMPRLNNFIIDGNLEITCTLRPRYVDPYANPRISDDGY